MYEISTERITLNFTAGAQRALNAAAGWNSGSNALDVPEVLLGLLAEPECRAALLLGQRGIGAAQVQKQFPALAASNVAADGEARRFSTSLRACLTKAEELLHEYPRPLELATEHLLLGIAAAENDVARWLREQGLDVRQLEAEVHRLSGHEPGPLPLAAAGLAIEPAASGEPEFADTAEFPQHETLGVLRMIDAAANRAGEGLRVVEDYLRFVLDDRHLTSECKRIRHGLTEALGALPSIERHAARETLADVGTSVSLPAELVRQDSAALVAANFKRVEQSLRSLEESAKMALPQAALALERLRYATYTLERAADIARDSRERLANAVLYVLVDGCETQEDFANLIAALVEARVSVIQLRDKRLADRELLARARELRRQTAGSQSLFIMNDRPDLAVLAEADGVHVGQEELSVKDARRIIGPRGLIGVSTHSLDDARRAVLDGASYIGVGPTFPSGTKSFDEYKGPQLLSEVRAEISLPAFAIGGITLANLPQVLATGFTRVAVSGAICGAPDPRAAAREFLKALGNV